MYPNHHQHHQQAAAAAQAAYYQQHHQHHHHPQYSYLPSPTSATGMEGQTHVYPSPPQQPHLGLPGHHYQSSTGSGHSSPSSDAEMAHASTSSAAAAAAARYRAISKSPSTSSTGLPSAATTGRARRGSPVSMDAPTQPRRYSTTSSTSRKEVPAFFSRRRGAYAQQISDGEEDELTEEPLPSNATDLEKIEWRRRQNTLAARRSRKRKQAHQNYLEDAVDRLNVEKEIWKTRAETLRQLCISNGIPCPDWT